MSGYVVKDIYVYIIVIMGKLTKYIISDGSVTLKKLAFSNLILVNIFFIISGKLVTILDTGQSLLGILTGICILFPFRDIYAYYMHIGYIFYVIIGSVVSHNMYHLYYTSLILLVTVMSRIYFRKCILNDTHPEINTINKKNKLATINSYINWDYTFSLLLLIAVYRLKILKL
jgi:hypothetical protein